jgi:Tfp pilus assembly protein PilN
MRYSINLATRTYLDHGQLNRIAYGTIVLLLIALAWNISRFASNMGEQKRLDTEISSLQSKTSGKVTTAPESEVQKQKALIRFYNEIIVRKSTDWLAVFEKIEVATPEGVAVASLVPEKKNGDWKLDGRARSFKGVQAYLNKLETTGGITNIQLLSHQNIAGEKTQGVQFLISCTVLTK